MSIFSKKLIIILFLLFAANTSYTQEIQIVLGKNNIAANQYFTITVLVKNGNLQNYSPFPEIKGFSKRGTSSSSSMNFVNGRMSSTNSLITNYLPQGEGTFTLPAFKIKINGKEISSAGTTIKVGPPIQQQSQSRDPFADLFNFDPFGRRKPQSQEFVNVNADAFFGVLANKSEVFVGEGVTITLAFYVSKTNRAQMNFYDLQNQLPDILKKIKPKDCWEENFGIEEITPEEVLVNGKAYTQYKFYQGCFYPLNTEDIILPSAELKMIKYDVAKNYSFFGQNRKETISSFHSRGRNIKVKELPPHPLRDKVSVGNYRLEENLKRNKLSTSEGLNYTFTIEGEGNIAGISTPNIPQSSNLEIYAPDINQTIKRANGRVVGSKKFNYYLSPYEPGTYELSNIFQWVFFNPATSKYDTLKANPTLYVDGESKKNTTIISSDLGSFYNRIGVADNDLINLYRNNTIRRVGMIIFSIFAIGLAILLIRSK